MRRINGLRRLMGKSILSCLFVLFASAGAIAQLNVPDLIADSMGPEVGKYITFEAIPSHLRVMPGETFHVALDAHIVKDWVYYGPDPGGPVKPASLGVRAPGFRIGEILWPKDFPKPTDFGDRIVDIYSYKKRAIVYVALTVPLDAKADPGEITLIPAGQVCGDSCLDIQPLTGTGRLTVSTSVTVGGGSMVNPSWEDDPAFSLGLGNARTVEQIRLARTPERHGVVATVRQSSPQAASEGEGAELDFWAAVVVALLAGLTLNIMPCVLPVIPIRILSIVQMASQSRRRFVTMGLAFALGMMLFFVAIAAINVILKLSLGRAFDINEGFQNPVVIITLAMIVLALAANLFGVFNIVVPTRVSALESDVQAQKSGHLKSTGMGIMMAVLATPCSFAFLAAALTYAQSASLAAGTAVILAIGLGMSAPHALLAAFPQLVDKLPRPGRWMEIFKQSTGFVLLLVVVWLLSTLRGDGTGYPYWVIAWGVILVMCLWIWGNWVRYDAPLKRKIVVRGIAVILAAGSGAWMLQPAKAPLLEAEKFDPAMIARARRDGKVVMVKFTAAWCGKCLQQEYQVFNTPEVAQAIRDRGVVYVKGDVTRSDLPAARWMRDNGYGVRIPMTLIFPPAGAPLPPLRGELTKELLIRKLDQAGG